MFVMIKKTIGTFAKTVAAFAIAVTFFSVTSFAGEFTVHPGKKYRATLSSAA
jgi:hypothetical protein